MFEIIRSIIIYPLSALLTVTVLWLLFYNLFEKVFKLTEASWKRLDYIWIFAGFLAVITLIFENNKDFNKRESQILKQSLKSYVQDINFLVKDGWACFKFTKTNMSPENIEQQQEDQDKLCEWSKKFKIELDTTGIPVSFVDTISIKKILFTTNVTDQYKERFFQLSRIINEDLYSYKKTQDNIKGKDWDDFKKTFGILFAVIAFSIRLSIVTHNVRASKTGKQHIAK